MAEQKVIMTDPRQEDYFYQEAIKTLRTNIQFAGMDVKTILFTSCYPYRDASIDLRISASRRSTFFPNFPISCERSNVISLFPSVG